MIRRPPRSPLFPYPTLSRSRPAPAVRVRWNENTDTPLPPDEPAGQNPPDGAILDYYLAHAASGPVTLEVLDARGNVVRRASRTSDRKSTRLNSSHGYISYAVFCLKKKKTGTT